MDGSGYYNNYNHLGWTELVSPPLYSRDGSRMVTVISTDQGQNVGFFPHIVIFRSVAQSSLVSRLLLLGATSLHTVQYVQE